MKVWCIYDNLADPDGNDDQHWHGAYLTKEKAEIELEKIKVGFRDNYSKWPERGEMVISRFYIEEYEVT